MASLSGCIGWPITGDKTIEFAKNPNEFVQSKIDTFGCRVFQTRVLNRAHVFVASSRGVKEILQDQAHVLDMGYKDFGYMYSLYGDLLIFNSDDEAIRLRKILCSTLRSDNMARHLAEVDVICSRVLEGLELNGPIPLYKQSKLLTTQICLTLFLGLDFDVASHEAGDIIDLTIAHWHGLISVPLSINVYGHKSGYSKAMAAKKRLEEIIRKQLEAGSLSQGSVFQLLKDAEFQSTAELANHLLLFVSALVPKALASLLVSFCMEMSKPQNVEKLRKASEDDSYLDDVLLEVKRLWPPFLGGRRKAKKDVIIDGYKVPEGYYIAYLTRAANCDPSVFPEPFHFNPERWKTCNEGDKDLIWTFGSGPRMCVGHDFIQKIIKWMQCISTAMSDNLKPNQQMAKVQSKFKNSLIIHELITKYLLQRYTWSIPPGQDLKYKWLPVSRPKADVQAVFLRRLDAVL